MKNNIPTRWKLASVSALVISLLGLSACSQTPTAVTTQTSLVPETLVTSPNDDREYATMTLPNGINVILVSDESVEKSAAALSVGVGLLQDPMTQQGMAHYLEHMLFLGTEKFPDTNEYTEFMTQNGGQHNAYTWLDITNYMFKINNDAFPEALDRFSDFFKAPKLYPEYTEKEINAVNAEWSMRREMDFFGQFKLARKMMGEHPANRFLIGNLETLGDKENSKLHPETVAFFEQYYSANIMNVAMIANRPLAEMKMLATNYFADIPNKNIPDPDVTDTLDLSQVGGKRVHYAPNQDVKQLNLDFTIRNNMADFAVKPNQYLAYLLYSEMPGTPAQLLRDKGWVSSFTAGAAPNQYGNYGTFYVNIELTDLGMQHREEIVALVMQYIDLIREEGVDQKYFNEIRTSLQNQFTFLEKGDEFGYVSNLAAAMQDYPLTNAINAGFTYAEFDEQAINNVLAQLTPETLKVWYISQQEKTDSQLHFYDGKYRIVDITDAEIASWQQPSEIAMNLPKVNTLLPENFKVFDLSDELKAQPKIVFDEAGIKVWQFASQDFPDQPKGLAKIYVNNPDNLSNIKNEVLLSIWADLYDLQTAALATEASIAGMNMSFSALNGFELTLNGFTDKQAALLENALTALEIDITEQGFAQAVDRYVRNITNAGKAFPINQVINKYRELVRSGVYSEEDLIATAQSLTVNDLQQVLQSTLANNQVRIFAFGNYAQADVQAMVAKLRAILPEQRTVTEYARSGRWAPQTGEVLVYQKDIDVADVALIDMHVHPQKGVAQRAQGLILQSHFRTVAFDKLRTEEQLAYAVGGFAPAIDDYTGLGLYIQTPVKGPADMQARFAAFKTEYAKALAEMTPELFGQLKNAALVSLKEQPKNLSDEVGQFIADWYQEKFSFDTQDKLIAAVEKVTLDDIKDFYQQTMLNPTAARLNIQLRGTKFVDKAFADLPNQTLITDVSDLKAIMQYQ